MEKIKEELRKLLESMGLSLVELSGRQTRDTWHFYAVIHKPEGVRIKDCTEATALLRPRLELAFPGKEVLLDVSSPGTDRVLKYREEYAIFKGRGVQILLNDGKTWHFGVITGSDVDSVFLRTGSGNEALRYDTILKARLDDSQEGEEDRCQANSRTP